MSDRASLLRLLRELTMPTQLRDRASVIENQILSLFEAVRDEEYQRAEKVGAELAELRRAVISLHNLINLGGDYAISRSDKTPMQLSDGIIIQDVLATIYKLIPEPPEVERWKKE